MNDAEGVFSAVQQDADARSDFGSQELLRLLVVTVGIGILLTVLGAVL